MDGTTAYSTRTRDYRDETIAAFADRETLLLDRIGALETLLRGALRAAIESGRRLDFERQARRRAEQQYHDLCETLLLKTGADEVAA